jgi:hypothetical protein
VVRGEYDGDRMHHHRFQGALQGTDLRSQRFEPAEGTQRFRQRVHPPLRSGTPLLVRRRYGVESI